MRSYRDQRSFDRPAAVDHHRSGYSLATTTSPLTTPTTPLNHHRSDLMIAHTGDYGSEWSRPPARSGHDVFGAVGSASTDVPWPPATAPAAHSLRSPYADVDQRSIVSSSQPPNLPYGDPYHTRQPARRSCVLPYAPKASMTSPPSQNVAQLERVVTELRSALRSIAQRTEDAMTAAREAMVLAQRRQNSDAGGAVAAAVTADLTAQLRATEARQERIAAELSVNLQRAMHESSHAVGRVAAVQQQCGRVAMDARAQTDVATRAVAPLASRVEALEAHMTVLQDRISATSTSESLAVASISTARTASVSSAAPLPTVVADTTDDDDPLSTANAVHEASGTEERPQPLRATHTDHEDSVSSTVTVEEGGKNGRGPSSEIGPPNRSTIGRLQLQLDDLQQKTQSLQRQLTQRMGHTQPRKQYDELLRRIRACEEAMPSAAHPDQTGKTSGSRPTTASPTSAREGSSASASLSAQLRSVEAQCEQRCSRLERQLQMHSEAFDAAMAAIQTTNEDVEDVEARLASTAQSSTSVDALAERLDRLGLLVRGRASTPSTESSSLATITTERDSDRTTSDHSGIASSPRSATACGSNAVDKHTSLCIPRSLSRTVRDDSVVAGNEATKPLPPMTRRSKSSMQSTMRPPPVKAARGAGLLAVVSWALRDAAAARSDALEARERTKQLERQMQYLCAHSNNVTAFNLMPEATSDSESHQPMLRRPRNHHTRQTSATRPDAPRPLRSGIAEALSPPQPQRRLVNPSQGLSLGSSTIA